MRLAALAAAVLASLAVAPAQGGVVPSRVQVSAKEFWFALSRKTVVEGPAIVELANFGEDPHDMRIRRIGGTHTYRTPVVQPGAYFDLSVKLVPGRYRVWCAVANHEALGMKAVLTVKKKK